MIPMPVVLADLALENMNALAIQDSPAQEVLLEIASSALEGHTNLCYVIRNALLVQRIPQHTEKEAVMSKNVSVILGMTKSGMNVCP